MASHRGGRSSEVTFSSQQRSGPLGNNTGALSRSQFCPPGTPFLPQDGQQWLVLPPPGPSLPPRSLLVWWAQAPESRGHSPRDRLKKSACPVKKKKKLGKSRRCLAVAWRFAGRPSAVGGGYVPKRLSLLRAGESTLDSIQILDRSRLWGLIKYPCT